jgi:hypothetical protein
MVDGIAKSGFQMYTSWTQVSKLLLYPITAFFLEDGKENIER